MNNQNNINAMNGDESHATSNDCAISNGKSKRAVRVSRSCLLVGRTLTRKHLAVRQSAGGLDAQVSEGTTGSEQLETCRNSERLQERMA